jgi:plastocyanin
VVAELNSARAVFAIVAGIPAAVVLLAVVWLVPTLRREARLLSSVVLVGLVALGAWAVFRSAGPQAEATPPLSASLPRGVAPAAPPVPPSSPRPQAPPCSPEGATVNVVARNISFDKKCLAAPADTAFTVSFDNADPGVPHNIHVFSADPSKNPGTKSLFKGEIVTGPRTVAYRVRALPKGTYFFHCDVHPPQMQGTFVVG